MLRLLSSVTSKWQEIGDLLGVNSDTIEGLCYSNFSDQVKLSKMLQSWLDNKPTPLTWHNLIKVIEGPLQKRSLAMEICQYLKERPGMLLCFVLCYHCACYTWLSLSFKTSYSHNMCVSNNNKSICFVDGENTPTSST